MLSALTSVRSVIDIQQLQAKLSLALAPIPNLTTTSESQGILTIHMFHSMVPVDYHS
jgi:hypothetical protein